MVDDAAALAASPAAAAILTALVTAGPQSRVALARRLGLSSAAVTETRGEGPNSPRGMTQRSDAVS